ncbi:hypothetical protein ACF0H5_005426 [Mactra antiquata]
MVKTRHTQDADEESDSAFPSLEDRKITRTRATDVHEDSDDSGVINFRKTNNEVVDESFIPKRSVRSSVKRVTYVEDYVDEVSDSDTENFHRTRRGRRGQRPSRFRNNGVQGGSVKTNDYDSTDEEKLPSRRVKKSEYLAKGKVTRQRMTADHAMASQSSKQIKRELSAPCGRVSSTG